MFYPVSNDDNMNIIRQDLLGNGSEGQVYMGLIIGSKKKVAVKEFKKQLNEKQIEFLLQLKNGQFQHIIKIYEVNLKPQTTNTIITHIIEFKPYLEPFLVMEIAQCNFLKYMEKQEFKELKKYQKYQLYIQMLKGVIELHSLNYIHRDLQPENFVCCFQEQNNISIKLIDFGIVKDLNTETRTTNIGNPIYMAPEVKWNMNINYDQSVDVWSMGLIMCEVLIGEPLFTYDLIKKFYKNEILQQADMDQLIDQQKQLSQEDTQLIKKILKVNSHERMKLDEIKKQVLNLLNKSKENTELQKQQPNLDKAIQCQNKALEINQIEAISYKNKGNSLNDEKKYDEAIQCFNKAIELNQNDEMVYNNKGYSLFNLKLYDQAIQCYNKSLDINPQNAIAYKNKGISLHYQRQYDQAIQCFNKTIELNPNDADTYKNKGYSLHNIQKYYEAIDCYNKALQINPNDADTYKNKGYSLHNLQKYYEAIDCYNKSLQINPNDADTYKNKGYSLHNLKQFDQAIQMYNIAEKFNPNDTDIYVNLGYSLNNLHKYYDAIKCFEKALEINPNCVDARNNLNLLITKIQWRPCLIM